MKPKPVTLAWIIFLSAVLCFIVLPLLAGCADQRFLSKEQDDDMKAKCEQGCAIVPVPLWEQILKKLQGTWL